MVFIIQPNLPTYPVKRKQTKETTEEKYKQDGNRLYQREDKFT